MKKLVVSVTNKCNFHCRHCLREYGNTPDLDISLMKKILPDLKKMGYSHIGITGGEPILYPKIDEFLKLITSGGLSFNIVSNGLLWNRYIPLVRKYRQNLTHMTFSLDAHNAEINDNIRQEGSFQKVMEAVNNIKMEDVPVVISTCLNKENKSFIKEMMSLMEKIKPAHINFNGIIETSSNKSIVLSQNERNECLSKINQLASDYNVKIRATSSLQTPRIIPFCEELNLTSMMLNPQGELCFCCNTIREGAILGSIKTDSFIDLYLKGLDIANSIRKERAKIIHKNEFPDNFCNCNFCSDFLDKYIK